MEKERRRQCLATEVDRWCVKGYDILRLELKDVVAYECGEGRDRYQVEVQLLEDTPEYVHVGLSLDDGGWRQFAPLSTSFLAYRAGRVDRPEIR